MTKPAALAQVKLLNTVKADPSKLVKARGLLCFHHFRHSSRDMGHGSIPQARSAKCEVGQGGF